MKTITLLLSIILLMFASVLKAQDDQNIINDGPQGPTLVVDAIFLGEIPSIESQIANGTGPSSQNPQLQFTAAGSYSISLEETNSGGSNSITKTDYLSVMEASACVPGYIEGTNDGDFISLVQLEGIVNATGPTPYPFYTDYSNLTANLTKGSSYTITLSAGTNPALNNISVWIDYNQDNSFDSSEKLGNVELLAAPETGTISFVVPLNAATGTTRMRVREVYGVTDIDPCSLQWYGETEDYRVYIPDMSYCEPAYILGSSYGNFISLVQLQEINNSSGPASAPYFTYYDAQTANLSSGGEYSLTVIAGTYPSGNNMIAWIDYDFDGTFEEEEKLGFVSLLAQPDVGTMTFTVPTTALNGTTRMRVREVFASLEFGPCNEEYYGETEDYKVNILPNDYCLPTYITGTSDGDYISLVQLGSINSATGASGSPFYTYYNGVSTDLNAGSAYTVTLSAGTYTENNSISVWIDYNNDGIFDVSEKLGTVILPAAPVTGTITFTVPAGAFPGTTRMRVREGYGNTDIDPCSLQYYGETEDYNVHIFNSNTILNLTAFIEGLYVYDYYGAYMNQANNELGPQFGLYIADQITVELHNESNYGIVDYSDPNVFLSLFGFAQVIIPSGYSGSYYLTVKHRNSIETTSASPVSLASPVVYFDFSQPSNVYGGNLLFMSGGYYAIYGGDVNQDGVIDTADMTPIDNDSANYASGYLDTDVNGDGLIDTADMTIVDNNAAGYVGAIMP